jgi:hypothetical protein
VMDLQDMACPRCGSTQVVRIVYGLPTAKTVASANRGEIKLGGCCVSRYSPRLYCKDCYYR